MTLYLLLILFSTTLRFLLISSSAARGHRYLNKFILRFSNLGRCFIPGLKCTVVLAEVDGLGTEEVLVDLNKQAKSPLSWVNGPKLLMSQSEELLVRYSHDVFGGTIWRFTGSLITQLRYEYLLIYKTYQIDSLATLLLGF